jgi:circadian clock protein KaiB
MAAQKKCSLKLYIAGISTDNQKAILDIKRLVKEKKYVLDLEVVDILEQPDRAMEEGVIATPTIMKVNPQPEAKVILDFSNSNKVIQAIDLLFEKSEDA